ncbi:hypothetical protein FE257_008344 [Aspergillus nanangensis]|uniref:N-alpha-acetyltransferase 40 n=1 Tax=Aspergillus nanangensis TaxID=2582783 RepID=A0AAD4CN23_ASPNN|nr:hypothetical protein FE257_008344 [Aspergillus nanangensis]
MHGSVKDGRVTKTKLASSTQRKSSRARTKQIPASNSNNNKPLPLVERVNKLPCSEFIALYIPPHARTVIPTISTTESPGEKQEPASSYKLDIYTAKTIPAADFEACFKLIEQTQSAAYASSGFGWSPAKKRKEMRLPDMKYIILRQVSGRYDATGEEEDGRTVGEFKGFLSFMVTYEDGKEVVYCYEIHLVPSAQGRGLGGLLMTKFADLGKRVGVEKAMLTVFKSNAKAGRLYSKLGYVVDEYSPRPRTLRNGTVVDVDYWIMSRGLRDE